MELSIEKTHEFLEDVIEDVFRKEKKIGMKIVQNILSDLKSVESSLDDIENQIDKEKDDLLSRSTVRFVAAIRGEIDNFKVDLEGRITHDTLKNTFDFLSKLFNTYNENGKKWFPKFGKEFKRELKTLQILMNKLFRNNGKLDKFLRDKFSDVKEAENIKQKLEHLSELEEKVRNNREKVSDLTTEKEKIEDRLMELENELMEMENDSLIKEEKKVFREQNQIKQKIQQELSKIKKSIKKFQKLVEHGNTTLRYGVTKRDLKDYFKKPFDSVMSDGNNYPKLRAILENIIAGLDDNIKMKDDKREKTLETIKEINEDLILKPMIDEYLDLQDKRQGILNELKAKGMDERMQELKKEISELTTKKDRTNADIEHEKENVINLLKKMKILKEDLENKIQELSGEKITILLSV
ncbi:MAG: hypothetical protein ACTSVI_08815 [Promethearchaeota archaeon]